MSLLPASIKRIRSNTNEKRWRHRFFHYKSMGAFCCHGNLSSDLICTKTLCSLSPTLVMLQIKFDLGWPAGFRDIQVWKCGRRRRRRTDDRPLLYYKLISWAFGSGELKMLSSRKSWCFTILFYWDFAKSWSQRQKVGVKYSKSGANERTLALTWKYCDYMFLFFCQILL